jgi:hypothetical protein
MNHKGCSGRWVGEIYTSGKRAGKVSGKTKGECQDKLDVKRASWTAASPPSATYTVA